MRALIFILIFLYDAITQAKVQIRLAGGLHNSKLDYTTDSVSFSILSDSGTIANAQLLIGGKSFGLFGFGSLANYQYRTTSTRTILNPTTSLLQVGAGLYYQMGGAQFYTRFSTAETPLLINIADTNYELKKYSQSLGEFGAKLYAYTKEYLLYLGLSGGAPLAKTQFESTNIDFTYTASGVSGVEFGGRSSFQFGFEAAMNWRSYKSTARMTLQDFSIGAFISFGSSLNQFGVEKYESVFGGGGSGGGSSR